jgi:hypothetical protein
MNPMLSYPSLSPVPTDTASPSLPTLNGGGGNGSPTFPPPFRRTVSTQPSDQGDQR